jgi:three-Cys-motif partner protein
MDVVSESVNRFGGRWTQHKLKLLDGYLQAYLKIFNGPGPASYYKTIYVDAFAGTGEVDTSKTLPDQAYLSFGENSSDVSEFLRGSARIAADRSPGFDRLFFVERSPRKADELERMLSEVGVSKERYDVKVGDANDSLRSWAAYTDWSKWRAVVFLDPFGMQVDWETIAVLGRTRGVDLWILFPLGAVNRLLTRREPPPPTWDAALTRIFGTDGWRDAFYDVKESSSLFGDETTELKQADFASISTYFLNRLKTVFHAVSPNARTLRNSQNSPLYLLCFAAANEKGAIPAVRIAAHLLRE